MPMIAVRDLKPGDVVELDGKPATIESARYGHGFSGSLEFKTARVWRMVIGGKEFLTHPAVEIKKLSEH